ncbi:hypothetical protein RHMOL_Rhmol02G0281400 [Rhododendron molle]|uniref:Uncharacterized protein n=1 Tax=Rhododendron molle TaxID=49168 RepID=A0ACC0PWR3_RHOML|nr:hypothetical protein RHMOL_Rhmol02G0281400 [Rhododendron molle]
MDGEYLHMEFLEASFKRFASEGRLVFKARLQRTMQILHSWSYILAKVGLVSRDLEIRFGLASKPTVPIQVKKMSLGNNTLFLGDNASVSVDASRYRGNKANCIYYTYDCWESYNDVKQGGGKDMGIFDLEDESPMPCYNGESFSSICPPMWVNPSSV